MHVKRERCSSRRRRAGPRITSYNVCYTKLLRVEFGLAFYSGNPFEMEEFRYRALGDYTVMFWIMIFCNSLAPLTLFSRRLWRNVKYLFVLV